MIQLLSILLLILFMILAIFDGLYLHLWKFELFNKTESLFEHKIHTARAILFPIIIYLLFVSDSNFDLYLGILFFILDLVVLTLDAYYEKDSREFMNGLPRWEYIIHLFANSLHFTSFTLIIMARYLSAPPHTSLLANNSDLVSLVGMNVIPGAVLMALIHLILTFDFGRNLWFNTKSKILGS